MSTRASIRDLTELVEVPAGRFTMGSADFYPDEGPVRDVDVSGFRMERHPVTNARFAVFVAETGYVTVAEQELDPADFPGADPELLVPGGLVFTPTPGPVPLSDWSRWWRWQPGASWRHPGGPGTDLEGRDEHPVVLVSYEDALAYAAWAGRDLPTEVEAEYAARGGGPATTYAWGEQPDPGGRIMANTWQGRFPYRNTGAKGWAGTSPVGAFPANGYGLVDTIGNVWEWTRTLYLVGADRDAADALAAAGDDGARPAPDPGASSCCAPQRAEALPAADLAASSRAPGETRPRRVLKGGSHLCAPEYCLRYRPPARSPQSEDSATTHIGFRCVVRG
ncbi:formylglycine-generating enzyme family protein [Phycicoccus sp. CSK15P-2]|uniref:formylglycine-generating enzyme family protein n=1 Tax=Phycicoccus sp. CSK15P-2 TaxID=2807627 RepID=UPI0019521E14|nr:formylglycine-generating enzyme family protein [Phycicoccus sp. CSK15P-2]MBM6402987.1 formylglycine-generating enzyme family protein [Phycicoccus sp. CSK15P-2]